MTFNEFTQTMSFKTRIRILFELQSYTWLMNFGRIIRSVIP